MPSGKNGSNGLNALPPVAMALKLEHEFAARQNMEEMKFVVATQQRSRSAVWQIVQVSFNMILDLD